MKPSIILTLAFTYFIHSSTIAQDVLGESLMTELLLCDNDSLKIYLPLDYVSSDTFSYMEGFIKTFKYEDGSSISILCGANANLSLGDNRPDYLFFRKSKVKWHEMTYERVSSEMRQAFDLAFDLMEKEN